MNSFQRYAVRVLSPLVEVEVTGNWVRVGPERSAVMLYATVDRLYEELTAGQPIPECDPRGTW